MARLSAILSVLVIVCGIADAHLLRVPAIELIAASDGAVALAGVACCLWGLERRSRRWRMGSFWGSLAGCSLVLIALGVLYGRVARTAPEKVTDTKLQPQ